MFKLNPYLFHGLDCSYSVNHNRVQVFILIVGGIEPRNFRWFHSDALSHQHVYPTEPEFLYLVSVTWICMFFYQPFCVPDVFLLPASQQLLSLNNSVCPTIYKKKWIQFFFSKGISAKWNANNLVKNLSCN